MQLHELKRGDVFRWAEALDAVTEEGKAQEIARLHVVKSAARSSADAVHVIDLRAPWDGRYFTEGCWMTCNPGLEVVKVHDSAEVERAAHFLGIL